MNFFIFANWENSRTLKSARQVFLNMPEDRAAFWNIPEIFENSETLQWRHLVFIVSMGCQDLAAADKPYSRGWVAGVLGSWEDSPPFTRPFPCQPALAGHMQGNRQRWTVRRHPRRVFCLFCTHLLSHPEGQAARVLGQRTSLCTPLP